MCYHSKFSPLSINNVAKFYLRLLNSINTSLSWVLSSTTSIYLISCSKRIKNDEIFTSGISILSEELSMIDCHYYCVLI